MPSRFSSPYPRKNSHKPRFPIPYSRNALTATKKEAQRPLLFFLMAKIRQKWRKKKDNNCTSILKVQDFTCERLIATSPTSVGVVEKDGGVDAGEAGSNRKGFGGNLWDEMN